MGVRKGTKVNLESCFSSLWCRQHILTSSRSWDVNTMRQTMQSLYQTGLGQNRFPRLPVYFYTKPIIWSVVVNRLHWTQKIHCHLHLLASSKERFHMYRALLHNNYISSLMLVNKDPWILVGNLPWEAKNKTKFTFSSSKMLSAGHTYW